MPRSPQAQRSIVDLSDFAGSFLADYCDPASRYAWPHYDTDRCPEELLAIDLLAPAFLSYPIRRDYFEPMLQTEVEGNCYAELFHAMRAVVAATDREVDTFEALWSPEETAAGDSKWSLVLRAVEASWKCRGLTSVAVTKILHRKRPHLVPLVDSRVREFYGVDSTADLMARIHADVSQHGSDLRSWAEPYQLPTGQPMSPLRALDIVIWMSFEK